MQEDEEEAACSQKAWKTRKEKAPLDLQKKKASIVTVDA